MINIGAALTHQTKLIENDINKNEHLITNTEEYIEINDIYTSTDLPCKGKANATHGKMKKKQTRV